MNIFTTGTEKKICDEIISWSAYALSEPNPLYNGLPACPYAKKSLENDKVAFLFKYEDNYQALYSTISAWNDAIDLVIIVDMKFEKDPDAFHEYLDDLNVAISDGMFIDPDIWVMGFHPHDEPNEYIDDETFTHLVDEEYAMIFVQRLTKVQEAADKLKQKGYYDTYLKEYNAEELFKRREQLHRRLTNGNETS